MTTTNKTTNPFNLINQQDDSGTTKLELTPQLIGLSNSKATELMRAVGEDEKLHDLANKVLDFGETQDTIDLILEVFGQEDIDSNSVFLEVADEDQLSRLLESRRSDRSKAKSKGPRTSVQVAQTFIGSMYAELLVRKAWNKPFQPTVQSLDYDELEQDQDALNRKIKSLQSKKSRLNKTQEFIEQDKIDFDETVAEIDRLSKLRINAPRVSSKTVIKNADAETLREALKLIDTSKMEGDELEKIQALMSQLG